MGCVMAERTRATDLDRFADHETRGVGDDDAPPDHGGTESGHVVRRPIDHRGDRFAVSRHTVETRPYASPRRPAPVVVEMFEAVGDPTPAAPPARGHAGPAPPEAGPLHVGA